jgi:uncharacterized protein YjbI with pentapeptide repeats
LKQSKLKAILKDHILWLGSDGKQGKYADLRNANLVDANLQGANLQGANLGGANLQGANLGGANLQGANLGGANLQDAYLRNANLQYADLRNANLENANLENANLVDAYLRGAYLRGAKFTTNFKKVAWFDHATFSENQIPWVALHPKYPKWAGTLTWVKAESKQVA